MHAQHCYVPVLMDVGPTCSLLLTYLSVCAYSQQCQPTCTSCRLHSDVITGVDWHQYTAYQISNGQVLVFQERTTRAVTWPQGSQCSCPTAVQPTQLPAVFLLPCSLQSTGSNVLLTHIHVCGGRRATNTRFQSSEVVGYPATDIWHDNWQFPQLCCALN